MLPALYGEADDQYAGAVYASGPSGGGSVLYSAAYGSGDGVVTVGYGDSGYDTGDRYGTGTDVGGEWYGADALLYGTAGDGYGSGYGGGLVVGERGDGYGVLLYGEADDGYWTLLDGDGRYAGPAGAAGYETAGSGRYPDVASVVEEFGIDWKYT